MSEGNRTQEDIFRSVVIALICGAAHQINSWHFIEGCEAVGATQTVCLNNEIGLVGLTDAVIYGSVYCGDICY